MLRLQFNPTKMVKYAVCMRPTSILTAPSARVLEISFLARTRSFSLKPSIKPSFSSNSNTPIPKVTESLSKSSVASADTPKSQAKSKVDLAGATLFTSLGVSGLSLSTLSAIALSGGDFNLILAKLTEWIPALSMITEKLDPALGTIAGLLLVHKVIAPARYLLTMSLLPWTLPYYRRVFKPWWSNFRAKQQQKKASTSDSR